MLVSNKSEIEAFAEYEDYGDIPTFEHYKVGDEVKLVQEYNAEEEYMGILIEHKLGFV